MTKKIKRPTATLGELLVQWILAGSKIVRKSSHDIKFMGTKVEVKAAKAYMTRDGVRGWSFRLPVASQKRWAYRFWFLCFNELYQLERLYVVPPEKIKGISRLWIGPETEKEWGKYKA